MKTSKLSPGAILPLLGLLLAAASAAQAAGKPKVGYLGADARTLSPEAVAALDAGAVAGLEAMTTIEAVSVPRVGVTRMKSGRPCASEDCAKAVAGRTGAEYLVLADVKRTGQADYGITLDLIRVRPFAIVFTGEDSCAGCVAAKLGRRMELSTSALVARLVESLESKPVITGKNEAASPAKGAEPPIPAPKPPRTEAPPSQWRWIPWTAGGVAVASLIGAGVAWKKNGDGACTPGSMERQCPRVYDTKGLAIGLAGAGVLAAGAAVLTFVKLRDEGGSEIALGTSGTSIVVSGRF